MPLPASGNPISLGQVNAELGIASATLISLNDAAVRSLFVISSGAIAMSDGYGKSASSVPYVSQTPSTPSHLCYYSGGNTNLSFYVSSGGLPITVYLQRAPYNTCSWTYYNGGSPIGTMTSLGWFSFNPSSAHTGGVNNAFRLILTNSSGTTITGGVGVVADYCTSETFCSYGDCVNTGNQPGCYNCSEQCNCDPCTYDTNCDCSTGYGSHGCDASCDCDWCNNYYIQDDPFTFTPNPDWPCPCSCQLCSHDCTCPCGETCPGNQNLQTCELVYPGHWYGSSTSAC